MSMPEKPCTAPSTSGVAVRQQASFTRYRVAALSGASTTTSYPATRASTFAASTRMGCFTTATSGLSVRSFSAAASTFALPTSGVAYRICRCRLATVTVSGSATPSRPTPAAAR